MPDEHPKISRILHLALAAVVREAGPCCRHWCCSRGLQPWAAAVGGRQMYIENILKFTQRNADTKKSTSLCVPETVGPGFRSLGQPIDTAIGYVSSCVAQIALSSPEPFNLMLD